MNLLFGYQGRISRGSWWIAQLTNIAIIIAILILAFLLKDENGALGSRSTSVTVGLIAIAAFPVMLWINTVSSIKRFHDRGKSGFWALIIFVPYIGSLWQIVECGFLAGDPEDNEYGPVLTPVIKASFEKEPSAIIDEQVKPKQRPFEYDLRPTIKTGRTRDYHPTSPRK